MQITIFNPDELVAKASATTEALAQSFLDEPDLVLEQRLIASMSADIQAAGFAPLDAGAFLDWGCVGHIHLFHCEGQSVIYYQPGSVIVADRV